MNIDRLNQLIEATKTFEGFDMEFHPTCLCGVAYFVANDRKAKLGADRSDYWVSGELASWLGVAPSQGWALALEVDATREEAIACLERLRDTGEVVW